jgi:formylglycine-generating enzyme required for sulfatase activity
MNSRLLLLVSFVTAFLFGGILLAADSLPANILEIRSSGDLILGVPSSAGLFGMRGEIFYSVTANGVSREVVPAAFTVIEILDITRVLVHVDRQSGEIQPGYSARIQTPPSVAGPPPPPAAPSTPPPAAAPAPAAAAGPASHASKPLTINQFLADMVQVPDGRADIGVDKSDCKYWNETPAHRIGIQSFYIDKHEVTVEEYIQFLKDTDHLPPSNWQDGHPPPGTEHLPVVNITYQDALDYCRWAHKRLPSEEEWEYTGRAGLYKFFPWGNRYIKNYSNIADLDLNGPVPVEGMVKDLSHFGAFDLAGNVSEWTSSEYLPYPGNTHSEPEYQQKLRVVRGGSFSAEEKFCRLVFRAAVDPDYKACDLGFRTAISQTELDELVRQGIVLAGGE